MSRAPDVLTLPSSPTPRVSAVVVAMEHPDLLERCLRSLEQHPPEGVEMEVVLLLNGATDAVRRFVDEHVRGARVLTSRVNRGFQGGLNLAFGAIRGQYLYSIHDDAWVDAGAIAALVRAADTIPGCGAFGSLLLNEDGTLQSAGHIVWSDASVSHIGSGICDDVPIEPRPVDLVSSASLLIRSETFAAIGGFDELTYPAGGGDTEACFAIRDLGQSVRVEPASVAHHRRSATSPSARRDLGRRRGQALIARRWRAVLDSHGEATRENVPAALERARTTAERLEAAPRQLSPRDGLRSLPREPGDPPELPYLLAELAFRDAYIAECEASIATLAEQRASLETALTAITSSRWWQLRSRVQPLLDLRRRLAGRR